MIPVGNLEETNDELRRDIADLEEELDDLQLTNEYLEDEKAELQSALNSADTDIADYLFELDHLREEHGELKQDVEGLLLLVEYWQGKAEQADQDLAAENLQIRRESDELNLQLAVEKGAKKFWMSAANRYLHELTELKSALRTLGGEGEN